MVRHGVDANYLIPYNGLVFSIFVFEVLKLLDRFNLITGSTMSFGTVRMSMATDQLRLAKDGKLTVH